MIIIDIFALPGQKAENCSLDLSKESIIKPISDDGMNCLSVDVWKWSLLLQFESNESWKCHTRILIF